MRRSFTFVPCSNFVTTAVAKARFNWYNIRKTTDNPKYGEIDYFKNEALKLEPRPGYIDRLGEVWSLMIAVSRDVFFKRDDNLIKHDGNYGLPQVDLSQPKAEYEGIAAAPEPVKKIFSIAYGERKDLTFQWKRKLMDKVRCNELDDESYEARIAKHTALIRHWTMLLHDMEKKPGWLRDAIYISINHRRKLLRLLREQDEASFQRVLKDLNIAYHVEPLPEDKPLQTRKGWVEYIIKEKVDIIKETKLREFHEELKKRQNAFLRQKEKLLSEFDAEEKRIRSELDSLKDEDDKILIPVGRYVGHTIDEVSENVMHDYYYRPVKGSAVSST
ncbi:unnamed protein product [Soboliphyme baturini]|uniref:Small ribosomal subunit protein uS15m n=1 Tax=Soboliphyme baturini TaxID=241478 RepID=A0A183IEP4_9BILA|nr:unnamed protein product [Soboliphyme baturini]